MRTLYKNKRRCCYANPTGEKRILDEWGNETLEVGVEYTEPAELEVNYSASVGKEAVEIFGTSTDYSRTMVFAGSCPLVEGSKLWIGINPTEKANYRVVKVADSPNGYMVAVSEI